jgi:hypothetical protein
LPEVKEAALTGTVAIAVLVVTAFIEHTVMTITTGTTFIAYPITPVAVNGPTGGAAARGSAKLTKHCVIG